MNISQYRKNVYKTLSIKPARTGLKDVARKTTTINLGHSLVGLKTEVGELLQCLSPYIQGSQLSEEMKSHAREELGDILYYLTVATKESKIKLPSTTKKIKLHGTILQSLLNVDSITTELLSVYKKIYYGRDLHVERIQHTLELLVPEVWALCFALTKLPVEIIMQANIAKLSLRYPLGEFTQTHAEIRLDKDVTTQDTAH